jgi:putative membrane protein
MRGLLIKLVVNAVALALTAALLSPHVEVDPYDSGAFAAVITYLVIALIFGIVNGTVGNLIRIVAFPVYILTLGLMALVVNALLLLLVASISTALGFGLHIESFGWGVVAAIVLGLISWILGLLLRPLARNRDR